MGWSDLRSDVKLEDSCFGPSCKFRWVLNTYCAGLPLHLSAINAAQYIVWRYSLVRSGIQKALLQQVTRACDAEFLAGDRSGLDPGAWRSGRLSDIWD